jgi:hypothetical protein
VFVSQERDGDGEPTHLCVMPTAGQHVAESDAEWARQMLNRPDDAGTASATDAEMTPQQYALLDAARDVALSTEAPAAELAGRHLARMAGETFGYPLPEPVQREGGLAGFLYGRPVNAEAETLRANLRNVRDALTETQGDLQTQIQITQDVRTERDQALAEAKKYKEAARKYQDEHAKEVAEVDTLRAKLADAERALAEIRPIVEELDDDTVHDGSYADILRSGIDRMKAAVLDAAAQIVERNVALVWEKGKLPGVDQATEYAAECLRAEARTARNEADLG